MTLASQAEEAVALMVECLGASLTAGLAAAGEAEADRGGTSTRTLSPNAACIYMSSSLELVSAALFDERRHVLNTVVLVHMERNGTLQKLLQYCGLVLRTALAQSSGGEGGQRNLSSGTEESKGCLPEPLLIPTPQPAAAGDGQADSAVIEAVAVMPSERYIPAAGKPSQPVTDAVKSLLSVIKRMANAGLIMTSPFSAALLNLSRRRIKERQAQEAAAAAAAAPARGTSEGAAQDEEEQPKAVGGGLKR
ncbi:unnamed protein product, partial [Chrysoparadoxa australica]